MSLLPRSAEEFSSAEYWERFFRRRGDKAFEWYADYNQLCGLLHKYIKPRDKVLVVGCGNSDLSEQLYDVGYRQLVNIDISDTVVSHMRQRNAERRPDLTFLQADATQTAFDGGSFQAALDKGTLDAMAAEEGGSLAGRMLAEVGRVLAVGGRYVCVSLAQESVLRLAVEHFVQEGWAIRVHCLGTQEEQDTPSDSAAFALPVFVLVCTKFRQPPPAPVLEMCQGEDGTPCRLSSTVALLSAVRERQAYALIRHKLRSGTCVGQTSALTLCHTPTGCPRYTLTVLDSPQLAKVPRANHFAIFIVPQGRESDWLYGSAEGRDQLARSANFRRLVVVAMHRDQEYADMQSVQSELSPMVMELAPRGMPANQQVPFLSVGGELGWREVVSRGVSALSGEYSVEDVRGEDGFLYRRLVFLHNVGVVQSESRLCAPAPAPSGKRNKKKKSKPAPPAVKGGVASVDRSFLCCAHHRVMVAGLSLLGLEDMGKLGWPDMAQFSSEGPVALCSCLSSDVAPGSAPSPTGPPITLLLVGLGGGGLPQFLRDFVPGVSVDVVELDPAVLDVAQQCFGFQPDERLKVVLGDGLEHISALEAKGGCFYDVIMFDVDCKDPTLGMSCPPPAFVEMALLEKVRNLLTARGVFMLNLVCRDSALRAHVLGRVRDVFPCMLSRDIEGEVNEVLLCVRRGGEQGEKDRANPEELRKACRRLQGALHTSHVSHRAQIDVAALLEDLKIA